MCDTVSVSVASSSAERVPARIEVLYELYEWCALSDASPKASLFSLSSSLEVVVALHSRRGLNFFIP